MARRTLVLIASATLVIAIGVIGLAASRYAGDPKPHSDTESAETTVTAQEGGSLSLSGATIFVPPGAISADAQLVASIKAAPPTEVSGSNSFGEFTPVAVPIEFQLLGAEILNPLQISFVVPPDAVLHPVIESRSDAVWMSFFTPTSRQWKATPSYFDPQSRTVTADVSHLSWWMPQTWDWRGIEVSLRQSLSALESGRAQESECPGVSGVTLSTTGGDDPAPPWDARQELATKDLQ